MGAINKRPGREASEAVGDDDLDESGRNPAGAPPRGRRRRARPRSLEDLKRAVDLVLAQIRGFGDVELALCGEIMRAAGGAVFGLDLVAFAVIQRSLALARGFCALVEDRNAFCAAPLLRLQVDSVIRFYGSSLLAVSHQMADHLLDDLPLRKLRTKDGKPLTDRILYEAAEKHYPWLPRVYKATSGFVHLSRPHIVGPMKNPKKNEQGHLAVDLEIDKHGFRWTDDLALEAALAFREATTALDELLRSWLRQKASTT